MNINIKLCNLINVLFLMILLLFLPNLVVGGNSKRARQQDKVWKTRKKTCENLHCSHLIPDEAYNCINNCTSNICYESVYGNDNGGPLEDGEIDDQRQRLFIGCVRKESKERFKRENTARLKSRKQKEIEAHAAAAEDNV